MNERTIFIEALDKESPAQRSSFLDEVCASDPALRQRVEALLQSHDSAGDFMGRPAPERFVQELTNSDNGAETRGETPVPVDDTQSEALGFLTPSDQPGVLGRLDHYEILDIVGRGGMGVVLRAFDETLHRVVAIKVMAAQLAANGAARKRFAREAQAAAAVSHDHIVTIHAVENGPAPYMVMQYVPGVSLQQRLDREGPLPLADIVRIGMETASGLSAAHALGLIHRDIKPANILLEKGADRVKITDFGMARAAADASLTRTGVVTGTPQYMAPEQARAGPIDARTDLFSLGSVLYAMCTGRPPFRANGSLAILKRVCEEAPSPIRETNPEIPEWLVAIVEKLQAKDPAQRYQSAAEVAQVLNGHLAQLTHSAAAPASATTHVANDASGSGAPPVKRRHLRRAAACLLVLLGIVSLTEATGITNLAATAIRIVTPDGTLVVEAHDPGVKVTVEKDGGLVLTGAGLEEIRLRPGSYHIQAAKNGTPVPLERELVSIVSGGRQVVAVKIETAGRTEPVALPVKVAATVPAKVATPAKVAMGPFVLLTAGKDYESLAEAVKQAGNGETIEVRGNGPFVSEPINIEGTAVTIRAGTGFRPVIKLSPEGIENKHPLFATNATLVLEGLELQRMPEEVPKSDAYRPIVHARGAPLWAVNCRFRSQFAAAVWGYSAVEVFRNCEFVGEGIAGRQRPGARIVFENCVHRTNGSAIFFDPDDPVQQDLSVRLRRCTFANRQPPVWFALQGALPTAADAAADFKPIRLEISESVFDGASVLATSQTKAFLDRSPELDGAEFEATLLRLLDWQGKSNLFSIGSTSVRWHVFGKEPLPPRGPTNLDEWKAYWKSADADSLEARPRFHGGDLRTRVGSALDELTPEDFRLRPDSAGYRAASNGKDLGADIDLVGPGPAYERWQKTAAYQQWLRETGQTTTHAPEARAFVLLGDKGVELRRFDTLADAVRSASDGDTIEVRGNGPFVTKPIVIPNNSLAIRAGDGFWPVIKADADEPGKHLISSHAPLVLEGLEFQWIDARPLEAGSGGCRLVESSGPRARLQAANCRFLMNRREGPSEGMSCLGSWDTSLCQLRNCQFLIAGHGSVVGGFLGIRGAPGSELAIENCLNLGRGVYLELTHGQPMKAVVKRNTLLGSQPPLALALCDKIELAATEKGPRPFQIETSDNVVEGPLQFSQFTRYVTKEKALDAGEAEQLMTRLIGWREQRNLYLFPDDEEFLRLITEMTPGQFTSVPLTLSTKGVTDWTKFWGMPETESRCGEARYDGGDLMEAARQRPQSLLPGDFRLHPGSAGYRAAQDSKDLGAEVDLIGPGPAYERWKTTSEYRQWLRNTGQSLAHARTAETKAFALLGARGIEVGRYDALGEALQFASDGDTIEVRGHGPFVTPSIEIRKQALVIRAGDGFRPVIRLDPEGAKAGAPLLAIWAPLVLEGLELQADSLAEIPLAPQHLLVSSRASVHVAHCRFIARRCSCIWVVDAPRLVVRNCELLGAEGRALGGRHAPGGGQWIIDNCVQATGTGLSYFYQHTSLQDASIRITRCSLTAEAGFRVDVSKLPTFAESGPTKLSRLDISDSILDTDKLLCVNHFPALAPPPAEAEALLGRLLDWQGRRNLYGEKLLQWSVGGKLLPPHGCQTLAEWKDYWQSSEADSRQGRPRFQRGDLLSRVTAAPEKVSARDFRLRPDSVGYRAGKDGKDLGADVDLVGPGPAYERWKTTSEYQQWLTDTGQLAKTGG